MRNRTIEFLLEQNRKQNAFFCSSDATLARRQYRGVHPTEIGALKCMDGRLHLPAITNTPLGIIQPFRNIGGKFNLGWPFFGEALKGWIDYAVGRGRDVVIFVTYHWSAGDEHRGCRGFNYDVDAARIFTAQLKHEIEEVFGIGHAVVYPIQIGIETDLEALVLHGENEILDLAKLDVKISQDELRLKLKALYPDMKLQVREDLLPLLMGNIGHIAEIRYLNRPPVDSEHKECIIGIGRGFDWLHIPNKALIIGPWSFDLRSPIIAAANIVLDNIKHGRIDPKDGVVLLSSAAYRESVGIEPLLAVKKARALADLALEVIRDEVPELSPLVQGLIGVVDMDTRFFKEIQFIEEIGEVDSLRSRKAKTLVLK